MNFSTSAMACDEKCLTITWRIENYDFCLQSTELESPSFFIDCVKATSYKFVLKPKLQSGTIILVCQKNIRSDAIIGLRIEIAIFYGSDSSPSREISFEKNENLPHYLFFYVLFHSKIYDREENELNPAKIFTIRCRIYGPVESHLEVGQCFMRTRMRVIRRAYIGFAKIFDKIPFHAQTTLEIKSAAPSTPLFTFVISFESGVNGSDRVWMEIIPYKKKLPKFCICKVFLLDSEGVKNKCTRSEISYDQDQPQEWKFPLSFRRGHLLQKQDKFLPGQTLTLKLEIAFTSGIEYEQIEDSELGFLISENRPVFPSAMDDLARLYEEGALCDMKLCTETETFHVHKNILGARSPVFKTMFTTDMREKANDCVHIVDLDADTVRRILKFLYSDSLGDLDLESAESPKDLDLESATCLYHAADKYNIKALTRMCSVIFKNSLKLSNCCDFLVLAEIYHDEYLKNIVMEFIVHHSEEFFHSSEWKELQKTNIVLAREAFYIVFSKALIQQVIRL